MNIELPCDHSLHNTFLQNSSLFTSLVSPRGISDPGFTAWSAAGDFIHPHLLYSGCPGKSLSYCPTLNFLFLPTVASSSCEPVDDKQIRKTINTSISFFHLELLKQMPPVAPSMIPFKDAHEITGS